MGNRDYEDLALLNICWFYKSGMITEKQFLKKITNIPHSFEKFNKNTIEIK